MANLMVGWLKPGVVHEWWWGCGGSVVVGGGGGGGGGVVVVALSTSREMHPASQLEINDQYTLIDK